MGSRLWRFGFGLRDNGAGQATRILIGLGYAVFASDDVAKTSISRSNRKCFEMVFKLLDLSTLETHFKIQKIMIEVCAKRQIEARLSRFRFGLRDFRSGFQDFEFGFQDSGSGLPYLYSKLSGFGSGL